MHDFQAANIVFRRLHRDNTIQLRRGEVGIQSSFMV